MMIKSNQLADQEQNSTNKIIIQLLNQLEIDHNIGKISAEKYINL